MPSKNSKNKKNKKLNTGGNTDLKTSPEKKSKNTAKPYHFDKTKLNFNFSDEKNSHKENITDEKSVAKAFSDKGFVTAHFYPTNSPKIIDETIISTPTPENDESNVDKSDDKDVTMKQLLADTENKVLSAEEVENSEEDPIDDVFLQISDYTFEGEEKEQKESVNLGMRELFDITSSTPHIDTKQKTAEFYILPENGNSPNKEDYVFVEKKIKAPVFVPVDTEARRENEAILSSLTADDIKNKIDGGKERRVFAAVLRSFAMVFCLVVLVVSSFNLVSGFVQKSREREKNEQFRDAFNSGEIGYETIGYAKKDTSLSPDERLYSDEGTIYKAPELEVYDMHEKYERMLPNLQALKYVNSSAFAWIKVSGTRVDYPVVRSPQGDNDYYLSHGIDRTYSMSGAVFTDYNNSTKLSNNKNTCVYGHNMNDGTMFQTIMNFKEKNQFLNSTIEMYTAEGLYVYTPFAVYDALPTESFFKTEFATEEDFLVFLDDIRSKSIFKNNDVILDKNSKVVTLITCTNTVTDKRFVVHGVLEEIVK